MAKPSDEIEIQDGNEEADKKIRVTAVEAKFALARKIISDLREQLAGLERLLANADEMTEDDLTNLVKVKPSDNGEYIGPGAENKMVEGVFDGQNMVGADGRQYIIPPNYASKSKLVEGDILKLTIQPNGSFVYKQIGPIERQRAMGTLTRDEVTNDWRVMATGRKYSVLAAAVSYHKGQAGDEAVILIPKAAPSKWAAIENVIKHED